MKRNLYYWGKNEDIYKVRMTKEELETEAEEYCGNLDESKIKDFITDAFKDGAEFGYNKAKEEMVQNGLALQSDMDKTIEQNIALKKQIEKMKCCFNCKHYTSFNNACMEYGYFLYECDMSKWEIKE